MSDKGSTIDDFNAIAGAVFVRLYAAFPVPVYFDPGEVAEDLGVPVDWKTTEDGRQFSVTTDPLPSQRDFQTVYFAVIEWLVHEGFVRERGLERVLTAKALTALNQTPGAIAPGPTLGARLGGAVKGAGTEIGRSAISELVGAVIGAAVKQFVS